MKNGKYIQYSRIFHTFAWIKTLAESPCHIMRCCLRILEFPYWINLLQLMYKYGWAVALMKSIVTIPIFLLGVSAPSLGLHHAMDLVRRKVLKQYC